MKTRPNSSTASFMLIATESVTSWACAGLPTASSTRTPRAMRIRTDMRSSHQAGIDIQLHGTRAARRRSKCTGRHNDHVTGSPHGYGTIQGYAAPVSAAETPSPLVRAELLSETASIRPGETFWVALRQEITPGWHTYWGVNPGDAGEPTRIEWRLPAGVTAGEIAWPYPSRFPVGIAMSYGYENGVVLPIPMTVSGAVASGTTLALRGQVSWLVC